MYRDGSMLARLDASFGILSLQATWKQPELKVGIWLCAPPHLFSHVLMLSLPREDQQTGPELLSRTP